MLCFVAVLESRSPGNTHRGIEMRAWFTHPFIKTLSFAIGRPFIFRAQGSETERRDQPSGGLFVWRYSARQLHISTQAAPRKYWCTARPGVSLPAEAVRRAAFIGTSFGFANWESCRPFNGSTQPKALDGPQPSPELGPLLLGKEKPAG
jgi:hypothetical protein